MDPFSFAPLASLLFAVYAAVAGFAQFIHPVVGSASAAVAIVALTVVMRTVLLPVGFSQVNAEVARRRLAPDLARLRRRYSNDPALLRTKSMELYRSEGVSPTAGLLPALAQVPVISMVYALFVHPVIAGHANVLLSASLLTAPLGSSFLSAAGAAFAAGATGATLVPVAVFAGLLVVIGVVAGFTRRSTLRVGALDTDAGGASIPGAAALVAALSWTPFLTVIFAAIVPLAATIYLTVTTAWTLVERRLLRRRVGLLV